MIKVCMVIHNYYSRDGRVRRYVDSLVESGAELHVLSLRDKNGAHLEKNGMRLFTIPLGRRYKNRGNYLIEYGMAFILYTLWLLWLYMKNRYDVIHVHNMPDFLVFAALIPRLLGAKLILDIHDPMPEFYMSKYESQENALVVRFLRLQEKISARFAHEVITANSYFKENLRKRGIPSDKITVVANVADTQIFNRNGCRRECSGNDKHFTLIYPGTIAPRYGLEVAVRALPLLTKPIPKIRLLIIGPYVEHVNDLANLAEQLGVSAFLQVRPAIPIDEVPRQIMQADVGVYTALSDPHMCIATPTKVLEYAIMGIPIIASRLKILERLFTDSALMFFEPGNVDQFARCVLELYQNPARRDTLVQNADKIFVRHHSWYDERNIYFGLLNRLLELPTMMAANCDAITRVQRS